MNKLFAEINIGSSFTRKGERVIKICNGYFLIRPNPNGAGSRMVNAMIEKTGELIHVDGCLCVKEEREWAYQIQG